MVVVALSEIIDNINQNKDSQMVKQDLLNLKELLASFRCPQNTDVQNFINYNAYDYDKSQRAKTYLCFENDQLVAYYSLTVKTLELSPDIPQEIKKKICYGLTKQDEMAAYLIAQIGKDNRCKIKSILKTILNAAFENIKRAQKEVGGRVIYLECEKNNQKLKKLYLDSKFTYLQSTQKYDQMIMFFK